MSDLIPVNACFDKKDHHWHAWWYTSEGGGHMLSYRDSSAKGFKTHMCPGVGETKKCWDEVDRSEDDPRLDRTVRCELLDGHVGDHVSLHGEYRWSGPDADLAAAGAGVEMDREALALVAADGFRIAREEYDADEPTAWRQVVTDILAARGDAAPTVSAADLNREWRITYGLPYLESTPRWLLDLFKALGIEVR